MNGSPAFSNPNTQRLFLALWPPTELGRELGRLAAKIDPGPGRYVVPEDIHLTLVFLGSVDASFRGCAERVAVAIRAESFTLVLEQIACWPKAGVLWAGPRQVPASLLHLVRELNAGLTACGHTAEQRAYAPHLTLARKLRSCPAPQSIEPLKWEVHRFSLVQSRTRADGARYEILRSWPLNSP